MSTPATTTSRTDKNLDAALATVQTEIGRTDGKASGCCQGLEVLVRQPRWYPAAIVWNTFFVSQRFSSSILTTP
jgi:hypothetical protein